MNKYIALVFIFVFSLSAYGAGEAPKETKVEWKTATLAGGLFWFLDKEFDNALGTKDCVTGYSGGSKENAYFDLVSEGKTKHYFAIQITYNPLEISFEKILDVFWQNINPQDDSGQFIDRGQSYSTVIFYHDEEQKKVAEKSLNDLSNKKIFEKKIVTKILPYKNFFKAENRHQNTFQWYKGNFQRYKEYSGRNTFKNKYWKETIVLEKKSIKII